MPFPDLPGRAGTIGQGSRAKQEVDMTSNSTVRRTTDSETSLPKPTGTGGIYPWEAALESSGIDITIMIPCYNEEKNVERAINDVLGAVDIVKVSYEIIVIDDHSADNTSAVVKKFIDEHPDLPITLHRNPKNLGLAATFLKGAYMARGRYYRMVCGDAVEPPEGIANVIKHIGSSDLIIPYLETKPEGKAPWRLALSGLFVKIVNTLSGQSLRYYNGMPVYKTFDLIRLHSRSKGFGFQAETITRMLMEGRSYQEVPFVSVERATGKSTAVTLYNFLSVGKSLLMIVENRIRSVIAARRHRGS